MKNAPESHSGLHHNILSGLETLELELEHMMAYGTDHLDHIFQRLVNLRDLAWDNQFDIGFEEVVDTFERVFAKAYYLAPDYAEHYSWIPNQMRDAA